MAPTVGQKEIRSYIFRQHATTTYWSKRLLIIEREAEDWTCENWFMKEKTVAMWSDNELFGLGIIG
jgi:hypothetical protein